MSEELQTTISHPGETIRRFLVHSAHFEQVPTEVAGPAIFFGIPDKLSRAMSVAGG